MAINFTKVEVLSPGFVANTLQGPKNQDELGDLLDFIFDIVVPLSSPRTCYLTRKLEKANESRGAQGTVVYWFRVFRYRSQTGHANFRFDLMKN